MTLQPPSNRDDTGNGLQRALLAPRPTATLQGVHAQQQVHTAVAAVDCRRCDAAGVPFADQSAIVRVSAVNVGRSDRIAPRANSILPHLSTRHHDPANDCTVNIALHS